MTAYKVTKIMRIFHFKHTKFDKVQLLISKDFAKHKLNPYIVLYEYV